MKNRLTLITVLATATLLSSAAMAHGGNDHDGYRGYGNPWQARHHRHHDWRPAPPPVVYVTPRPVVVPAPAYYPAAPVYAPPPVFYPPAPVRYGPPPVYYPTGDRVAGQVVGAVAGGVIGNVIGQGALAPTAVGAVVGGIIGGNLME